jgi:hypothetical protein
MVQDCVSVLSCQVFPAQQLSSNYRVGSSGSHSALLTVFIIIIIQASKCVTGLVSSLKHQVAALTHVCIVRVPADGVFNHPVYANP